MKRQRKREKRQQEDRVRTLFALASANKGREARYSGLARKIAMRSRLRIPKDLKMHLCKHCNSYMRPGVSCRVRIVKPNIVYYCTKCRRYTKKRMDMKVKA